MKVAEALLLLIVVAALVVAIINVIIAIHKSRSPWVLEEREEFSPELDKHIAFFAIKPGHEAQRLSPWRDTYDDDFSALWAEDRANAESKVGFMNLGRRKQIGA